MGVMFVRREPQLVVAERVLNSGLQIKTGAGLRFIRQGRLAMYESESGGQMRQRVMTDGHSLVSGDLGVERLSD